MSIQSAFSFIMLLLIDYRIISQVWNFILNICQPNERLLYQNGNDNGSATTMPRLTRQISNIAHEDEDVIGEEERIRTSPDHVLMETDVLVLNQVEKVYHGSFHAVDQISIGVKQRECFGLLGVNGA
jgi:ABC-type glutathione transport system ATPase component